MAEWFPRLILGAVFGGEGLERNGMSLGAARFTNVAALLAMPIFNAGRTQAINDIAESGQKEAVLRYEDAIVRALEDVENSARRARRRTATRATAAERCRRQPTPRSAARNRCTTAGRSTSCRCSTRSACACRCASARTTPTRKLLLDSVQLYKALGGGWEVFEPSTTPTAAQSKQSPNS